MTYEKITTNNLKQKNYSISYNEAKSKLLRSLAPIRSKK